MRAEISGAKASCATVGIKTFCDTRAWVVGWQTVPLPSGSTVSQAGNWKRDVVIYSSLPGGLPQRTAGTLKRGCGPWATTLAVRRIVADGTDRDFHGAEQSARDRFFRVRGAGRPTAEACEGWVAEHAREPGHRRQKRLNLHLAEVHDGNRDSLTKGADAETHRSALRRHSGMSLSKENLAALFEHSGGGPCDCGAPITRSACDRCRSPVCGVCLDRSDCVVCERSSCRRCIQVKTCADCSAQYCQLCRDFHECPRCGDSGCIACRPAGSLCDFCRVPLI